MWAFFGFQTGHFPWRMQWAGVAPLHLHPEQIFFFARQLAWCFLSSSGSFQGVEVERPDIHSMVDHVINLLHKAEVESDETQMENLHQSEVTMLDDHARWKENSKKKAQ